MEVMKSIKAGTATINGTNGADWKIYVTGKRNRQSIVWSNDGLVFVSYDHYDTFYEIVGG